VEVHCQWHAIDQEGSLIRLKMMCDPLAQEGNAAEVAKGLNGVEVVFTVINSDELRTTTERGDFRMIRVASK